jgi:hypothetical protein
VRSRLLGDRLPVEQTPHLGRIDLHVLPRFDHSSI